MSDILVCSQPTGIRAELPSTFLGRSKGALLTGYSQSITKKYFFPSDTINRTILSKWQVLFKSHCPFYLEQPPSADVFRVSLSQSTLLLTHQGKEAWDWPERCLPMSLHNIVVSLQLMTWFVMAHCMVFVLSLLVSLHGSGLLNV